MLRAYVASLCIFIAAVRRVGCPCACMLLFRTTQLMARGDGRNAIKIAMVFYSARRRQGSTSASTCRRSFCHHPRILVVSRLPARYFKEEMTARNVYVINKLRWDRRALKNVASALKDYNQTGGRKYDFPETVSASHAVGDQTPFDSDTSPPSHSSPVALLQFLYMPSMVFPLSS